MLLFPAPFLLLLFHRNIKSKSVVSSSFRFVSIYVQQNMVLNSLKTPCHSLYIASCKSITLFSLPASASMRLPLIGQRSTSSAARISLDLKVSVPSSPGKELPSPPPHPPIALRHLSNDQRNGRTKDTSCMIHTAEQQKSPLPVHRSSLVRVSVPESVIVGLQDTTMMIPFLHCNQSFACSCRALESNQ